MTNPYLLDDPQAIAAADPSRMGDRLLALPDQARLGWDLGNGALLVIRQPFAKGAVHVGIR